jgi:hypothetical protein
VRPTSTPQRPTETLGAPQILGAGAAIAAWIAVVGGARVWARLHAAEIPATQTLSVLPRQLLIVEGPQALLVPLLIGGAIAIFVYYSRRRSAREAEAIGAQASEPPRVDAAPDGGEDAMEGVASPSGGGEGARAITAAECAGASTRRLLPDPAAKRDPSPKDTAAEETTSEEVSEGTDEDSAKTQISASKGTEGLPKGRMGFGFLKLATGTRASSKSEQLKPPKGEPQPVKQKKGFVEWLKGTSGSAEPVRALTRLNDEYTIPALFGMAALVVAGMLALVLVIVAVEWWVIFISCAVAAALAVLSVGLKRPGLALVVAVAGPLIGAVVAMTLVVWPRYIVAMTVLTLLLVWLMLGALRGRSAGGVALTVFAALALWSGAVGFLRLAGAREPELETATVERRAAAALTGFYLGGSGGDVYLASFDRPRRVMLVQEEDVVSLSFGQPAKVEVAETDSKDEGGKTGPAEPGVTTPGADGEAPTLIEKRSRIDGVLLRLEVVGLRRGSGLIAIDFRLTNLETKTSGRSFVIGRALDDGVNDGRGNEGDSLDGLDVIDPDRNLWYPVARDERGHRLCTGGLNSLVLDPQESAILWATFGRPAGRSLTLHVPHFPTFQTRR